MLLALASWWYTAGWAKLAKRASGHVASTLNAFSVGLLLGSLFEPFRQIDATKRSGGSFDMKLRAFGDRLFSRIFGAVLRTIFIIIGLISAVLAMLFAAAEIILWPVLPLLPVAGIALTFAGVGV